MLINKTDIKQFMYKFFTLKKRIVIIFIISTFIPAICIVLVSYLTISSILNNKIKTGIQSNLVQVQLSLENTIENLNNVSQQLSTQGSIGEELSEYLSSNEPYARSNYLKDLKTQLNLICYTNPSLGLVMYYFKDDDSNILANSTVKDNFTIKKLPLFASYYKISYYGPHISNDRFNNKYVISAVRKVDLTDRDDVYVYIESGFNLTNNILNDDNLVGKTLHIMTDNNGRISYSDISKIFKVNSFFMTGGVKNNSGVIKDYYWYKSTSNQGWSIISLIPKAEQNKEKNIWISRIFILFLCFCVFDLILALVLWKTFYKPLNKFTKEIKWIEQSNFSLQSTKTNIPEFDYLLVQFQNMKFQILELFNEVKRKEKLRADIEIEKLLYQINPHFLMNTLNTVHWMATMNGQIEIDQVVMSLNKLLSYNLGKKGSNSTIGEEISALKEYLVLQQIRYDFHFDLQIKADDYVLNLPIPRFILQPIVENSIYHGLKSDGYIGVDVKLTDKINILIQDNGEGMSEETIFSLLNKFDSKPEKAGMGIGMNYVMRMIESFYEGKGKIEISSEVGKGTNVLLILPILKEND